MRSVDILTKAIFIFLGINMILWLGVDYSFTSELQKKDEVIARQYASLVNYRDNKRDSIKFRCVHCGWGHVLSEIDTSAYRIRESVYRKYRKK